MISPLETQENGLSRSILRIEKTSDIFGGFSDPSADRQSVCTGERVSTRAHSSLGQVNAGMPAALRPADIESGASASSKQRHTRGRRAGSSHELASLLLQLLSIFVIQDIFQDIRSLKCGFVEAFGGPGSFRTVWNPERKKRLEGIVGWVSLEPLGFETAFILLVMQKVC